MKDIKSIICVIALLSFATKMSLARGKVAPSLSINWYSVDGGGGTSVGGSFELAWTIGQHDAGPAMNGGDYSVIGGFWTGATTPQCFGDLNFDDTVNVDDLLVLIGAWGPNTVPADLDDNGQVNVDDLLLLIGAWGPC